MLKLYTVTELKKNSLKYKKKFKNCKQNLGKNAYNLVIDNNLTKYSYSNNH